MPCSKATLAMVDNCHLIDSNMESKKGSNKVEVFDYGHPDHQNYVVIRNTTLIDSYPCWVVPVGGNATKRSLADPYEPGHMRSRGLLNVSGYQYCETGETLHPNGIAAGYGAYASPGGFGAGPCPTALLLVKNCLLHQQDAGKAMCGFTSVEDVRFEDSVMITDGVSIPWNINEYAYRADDPTGTRGTPPTKTLTFANCRTRGIQLVFKRLAGPDKYVSVPEDLRGRSLTYDCLTGNITSDVVYDPVADAYDLAGLINTLDPLNGITGVPGDFDWGVPGVTV